MPKRGCGARARAPTPSGTSSTPSRTPGTSWTPCTRSRSMVSWWPWGHGDVVVWLGLRLPACSGVLWLACKWLLGPACPQTCTHGTAAMLFLALCEHGAHSAVTRGRGEGEGGSPGSAAPAEPLRGQHQPLLSSCSHHRARPGWQRGESPPAPGLLPGHRHALGDQGEVWLLLSPACLSCSLSPRCSWHLRGASPTPSAPPALGCPLAPCLAQPLGCAHRCGAVTAGWGHLGSVGTSSVVGDALGGSQAAGGGMAPSHQEGSAPV